MIGFMPITDNSIEQISTCFVHRMLGESDE